jgi:hypothetical protein
VFWSRSRICSKQRSGTMDVLKPLYDTTNLLQINAQNNRVNLQQVAYPVARDWCLFFKTVSSRFTLGNKKVSLQHQPPTQSSTMIGRRHHLRRANSTGRPWSPPNRPAINDQRGHLWTPNQSPATNLDTRAHRSCFP